MTGRVRIAFLFGGTLAALLPGGAAEAGPDLPRLTGIIVSSDRSAAIFEDARGIITTLSEGETMEGLTVQSIGPQGVRLVGPNRTVMIRPTPSGIVADPVDTGGVTFGLIVNPPGPPDD